VGTTLRERGKIEREKKVYNLSLLSHKLPYFKGKPQVDINLLIVCVYILEPYSIILFQLLMGRNAIELKLPALLVDHIVL